METVALALLTISAGVWVGAIVFQSAVVAPAVFVDLDEASARSFLRTLFPRFFRLGLICGALMLASLLGFVAVSGWSSTGVLLASTTLVMIILEAISLALVPHINAARDAGEAGQATFERLHRTSVLLTVAILLLGISVLAIVAARAAAGV
jgi:hypothetical protein